MQPALERQQEQRYQRAPGQRRRTGFAQPQPITAEPQEQRIAHKLGRGNRSEGAHYFTSSVRLPVVAITSRWYMGPTRAGLTGKPPSISLPTSWAAAIGARERIISPPACGCRWWPSPLAGTWVRHAPGLRETRPRSPPSAGRRDRKSVV